MTKRLYIHCLITLMVFLLSKVGSAESIPAKDSGSVILKEKIHIRIRASFSGNVVSYPLIIFGVSTGQGQVVNLMADYGSNKTLVFFLTAGVTVHKITPGYNFNSQPWTEITATINSSPDLFQLTVADTTISVQGLGFRRGDRYTVSVFQESGDTTDNRNENDMVINSVSVSDGASDRMNYTEIILLLMLVVADIIFFVIIHLRNKYLKRKNRQDQSLSIMIRNEKVSEKVQMKVSSVNMFGGFEIYNKAGEEINAHFSPMLKELFLLLICKQPEEGITSSALKEILWFDKNEESARNNRSVYFAKLRQILDTLGVYILANRSGKWTIDFEDIYVDFLEYNKIIRRETIGETDVSKLISIIRKGPLLPECTYSWLDEVKAGVADYTITILSDYADQLDKKMHPELLNSIADALFMVDPLNDLALMFKCRYYNGMGKVFLSKQLYSNYLKDYKSTYGEEYNKSYMDVISEQS